MIILRSARERRHRARNWERGGVRSATCFLPLSIFLLSCATFLLDSYDFRAVTLHCSSKESGTTYSSGTYYNLTGFTRFSHYDLFFTCWWYPVLWISITLFFSNSISKSEKKNICSAGIPFHLLSHTSQNTSCFNKPCFFLIEVILRIKFYRISPYGYRVPYRTRMTSALRCSIAHRMKVHLLFSSSRFFSPNFTSIIFTKIF